MTISPVQLTDTFDTWRIATNSVISAVNASIESTVLGNLTTSAKTDLIAAINEVNQRGVIVGLTGGTSDAITVTPVYTLSALVSGAVLVMTTLSANTTTTPTVNVSGKGTKTIVRVDGSAVRAGSLAANTSYILVYDGTYFRLINHTDLTLTDLLPSQTGNSGKFLTTDGTNASWGTVQALPSQTGNSGKFLTTDGTNASWGTVVSGSTVSQSGPTYVASGGTTTLSGQSVLAVYEQFAGQTFNVDYNTVGNYTQENSATGTQLVSGAFQLYNSAGAVIDTNTKLLIHADGTNNSTEIVDERGITPFGTGCMYFDGTSNFKIPSSYKIAFGTNQDFTYEGWVNNTSNATGFVVLDTRGGSVGLTFGWDLSTGKWYVDRTGQSSLYATAASSPIGWTAWAVVRRSGVTTLYIGGVSVASITESIAYTNAPIYLGSTNAGGSFMNGWQDQVRISNIARYTANYTPSTTEFVPDANTVYLFQGNDGHGSQMIRDSGKSGHEIRLAGGAVISNAQSKFGATCLSIDGNSGSYASIADTKFHSDFAVGSDNFTCEFFLRLNSIAATKNIVTLGGNTYSPQITFDTSDNNLHIYLSSNGTSFDIANGTAFGVVAANTWYHVSINRSGTSLYATLGGVVGATITVGSNTIFPGTTPLIYIGRTPGGTLNLNGYVDEFRFKRGQAVWTAGFTPPTSAYTTDDYTCALLHFEGSNNDKVTLDSSESSYGTNGFGDATTPALSFTGSATLTTTYTRGGNSTSLQLNGTSQYASMQFATPAAGHPIYFAPYEKLCIEGWYYPTNFAGTPVLFDLIGVTGAAATEHSVFLNASGVPQISLNNTIIGSAPTFTVNTWNHFALVREGRGWVGYTNGVAGTFNVPQTNLTYANEAYNLVLGAYRPNSPGLFFPGAIDSFRITHGSPRYTANFTPGNLVQDEQTSLLWVFNGSNGQKWVKELSKNTALIQTTNARTVRDGRYITPTTATISTSQAVFGTGSVSFNGSSFVDIGNLSDWQFSGNFTVECRVRRAATGVYHTIAAKAGATTSAIAWHLDVSSSDKARIHFASGSTEYIATGTTSLAANTWYHVAGVLSGTSLMIFVNGALEGSVTVSGSMNTSPNPARIGTFYDGSTNASYFNGFIDEVRISNTARYTSNFTSQAIPFGQQYVTGPFYVTTTAATQLDLSAFSSINSVAVTQSLPPGGSVKWVVSFDNRATWKYWSGSAWVAIASLTSTNIDTNGNDYLTLQTALAAWTPALGTTLDFAYTLKTTNQQYSPSVDNLTIGMSEYQMMSPITDYSVKRKKANGVQTLTFTRTKTGNANHVIDYI